MTGDLLNRVSVEKIDDIFRKFGSKPQEFQRELYKLLDRFFTELFPSVDEMVDAKKVVRSGTFTPEQTLLAKKYDELPTNVKAISAAHRKLSKVQAPVVGLQTTLYMKYSPGYASRNILGQGLGIALDMGLGRAVKTSIDAWLKPAVSMIAEKVGLGAKIDPFERHIAARVGQVVDDIGVAPHAMFESIGMAEVKNSKGFNILSYAQKGEKQTAADIVTFAIYDEIHKAMPGILSGPGSVQDLLVNKGILNEKQGKFFVKYLQDFNGMRIRLFRLYTLLSLIQR